MSSETPVCSTDDGQHYWDVLRVHIASLLAGSGAPDVVTYYCKYCRVRITERGPIHISGYGKTN